MLPARVPAASRLAYHGDFSTHLDSNVADLEEESRELFTFLKDYGLEGFLSKLAGVGIASIGDLELPVSDGRLKAAGIGGGHAALFRRAQKEAAEWVAQRVFMRTVHGVNHPDGFGYDSGEDGGDNAVVVAVAIPAPGAAVGVARRFEEKRRAAASAHTAEKGYDDEEEAMSAKERELEVRLRRAELEQAFVRHGQQQRPPPPPPLPGTRAVAMAAEKAAFGLNGSSAAGFIATPGMGGMGGGNLSEVEMARLCDAVHREGNDGDSASEHVSTPGMGGMGGGLAADDVDDTRLAGGSGGRGGRDLRSGAVDEFPDAVIHLPPEMRAAFRFKLLGLLTANLLGMLALAATIVLAPPARAALVGQSWSSGAGILGFFAGMLFISGARDTHPWNLVALFVFTVGAAGFFGLLHDKFSSYANFQILSYFAASMFLMTVAASSMVPNWMIEPFDPWRLPPNVAKSLATAIPEEHAAIRAYYLRVMREERGEGPHLPSLPLCACLSWVAVFGCGLAAVICTRFSTGGHFVAVHMFVGPVTVWFGFDAKAVEKRLGPDDFMLGVVSFWADAIICIFCSCCIVLAST